PFDQRMTPGNDGDQSLLDHLMLADDHFAGLMLGLREDFLKIVSIHSLMKSSNIMGSSLSERGKFPDTPGLGRVRLSPWPFQLQAWLGPGPRAQSNGFHCAAATSSIHRNKPEGHPPGQYCALADLSSRLKL